MRKKSNPSLRRVNPEAAVEPVELGMTLLTQSLRVASYRLLVHICLFLAMAVSAADVEIRLDNPPVNGSAIAMLFDSANTFVDLRNPLKSMTLPEEGSEPGYMRDLPDGEYALVVYQDMNANGQLDRNFIGIPREPLGFSNRYWPEGPPSFSRASFLLNGNQMKSVEIELKSVFGKFGRLGLGVGVVAQSSPYRNSGGVIVRPIPAISYVGDRLQILGLGIRYGFFKSKGIGLAATVGYRFGAYDESDSSFLRGLDDRRDTVMGGVAFKSTLPAGFSLSLGYEHDLLDRAGGGGIGRMSLDKSFQFGILTVAPQLAVNWLSSNLTHYEYGVSADRATVTRDAYSPGDAFVVDAGAGCFIELSDSWNLIVNGTISFLPSQLSDSPIVGQSHVIRGFIAINRLF